MGTQGLPEGDDALTGADYLALDHQPVLVHHAVVGEAAQRGDALKREGGREGGVCENGVFVVSTCLVFLESVKSQRPLGGGGGGHASQRVGETAETASDTPFQ